MLLQFGQLLTVHMDELAAHRAFAVVAGLLAEMGAQIFKAGRSACIDVVFCNHAFVHQLVQLPVDRRHAHGLTGPAEIVAYVRSGDVLAGNAFQKAPQLIALLGFIGLTLHGLPPEFDNSYHIISTLWEMSI